MKEPSNLKTTRKVYSTLLSKHNKTVSKLPKDLIPDTPPKSIKPKIVKESLRQRNLKLSRERNLSQFIMTDERIQNFKRFVKSPRDCFINAMLLMGMIDNTAANILRISFAGELGFMKEQIELIFTLKTSKPFKFYQMNYEKFSDTIKNTLKAGNVVFAGYTGHVFLIGKTYNGDILYIDPHTEVGICNLSDENCEKSIQNKGDYYLMYHTDTLLSKDELRKLGIHFE
jgi:hypothetical protein